MADDSYLQLSPDPIRFEPVSKVTNVFFDGTTKEVVSVRGGGTLGVVVQGLNSKKAFCMEHRGVINSLKFAPDHSILAVQRTANSLELLSFSDGEVGPGVVVDCKTKAATLLGFVWADHDDLVLITSHGVEFYHVSQERVFVRLTRNYSLPNCCWFVWSSECRMLVAATSGGGTVPGQMALYPFHFAPNHSTKLSKCIVDFGSTAGAVGDSKSSLHERDVCVAFVYRPAIMVLKHPTPGSQQQTAQLLIYSLQKECNTFKLTHVCQLGLTGSFAINVINSLIIVHHQSSKISLVFDIALGTEMKQGICHVHPVTRPASIRPYFLEEPLVTGSKRSSTESTSSATPPATTKIPCQLYAPTWVVFQPYVIIDALLGCLWTLQLDLPSFAATFTDSVQLITCLLNRRNAKSLVLQTVCNVTERKALHTLGPVFDRINAGYRRHLDAINSQTGAGACIGNVSLSTPTSSLLQPPTPGQHNMLSTLPPAVVVEAVDMYSSVLSPLMDKAYDLGKQKKVGKSLEKETSPLAADEDSKQENVSQKDSNIMKEEVSYLVSVTLEYIRSLTAAGIPVPDFLHQLIVNALLHTENFFQLHLLLQYHIIPDSKPLACVLLSRAGVYPACEQLSLDMLASLKTASDEIIEVLLANKQVTRALRYARANGLEEKLSCRKFLEAAMLTGDDKVFHSTFTLFSLRNARLAGSRPIGEGDHCEAYVKHFKNLFGDVPDYSSSST